jgi:hypothetical protein
VRRLVRRRPWDPGWGPSGLSRWLGLAGGSLVPPWLQSRRRAGVRIRTRMNVFVRYHFAGLLGGFRQSMVGQLVGSRGRLFESGGGLLAVA